MTGIAVCRDDRIIGRVSYFPIIIRIFALQNNLTPKNTYEQSYYNPNCHRSDGYDSDC